MIPTPDLSHLSKIDYEHVYEPAEDTFLLLDALEKDAEKLKEIKPTICLEIGSGSGCVSAFVAKIVGPNALYLSTDINPRACDCTRRTAVQNQVKVEPIQTSLVDPITLRLCHSVDLLIFNPPYVPTSEEEVILAQETRHIPGSWAGGQDGMQVTNLLLIEVEKLLSPRGRFYLVALKQNNIPDIRDRMLETYGLSSEIVIQRRAGGEHLFILCFTRQS